MLGNRRSRRAKWHNGHFTNGHALPKTEAVQDAIRARVLRKEAGERARIERKKQEAAS